MATRKNTGSMRIKKNTNSALISAFLDTPLLVDVDGVGPLALKRPAAAVLEGLRGKFLEAYDPYDKASGATDEVSKKLLSAVSEVLAISLNELDSTCLSLLYHTGCEGSPLYMAMLGFAGLDVTKVEKAREDADAEEEEEEEAHPGSPSVRDIDAPF